MFPHTLTDVTKIPCVNQLMTADNCTKLTNIFAVEQQNTARNDYKGSCFMLSSVSPGCRDMQLGSSCNFCNCSVQYSFFWPDCIVIKSVKNLSTNIELILQNTVSDVFMCHSIQVFCNSLPLIGTRCSYTFSCIESVEQLLSANRRRLETKQVQYSVKSNLHEKLEIIYYTALCQPVSPTACDHCTYSQF